MSALTAKYLVLDHGYVKYVAHLGSEELIIESARMSTGKGFLGWTAMRGCARCGALAQDNEIFWQQNNSCSLGGNHRYADLPGDAKLLEFLYRNRHMTPFEVPRLLVEVKAPLFVFREWQRHRIWVYNELSARYTQMPNEHYVPTPDRFQRKASTNKQESGAAGEPWGPEALRRFSENIEEEQQEIYARYEEFIGYGIPREVARVNTPVSRYSVMRAGVSLRGALDFLALRDHPAAQWEMQQYAKAFAQVVQELWPRTYALYEEYTKHAVTLSRTDAAQVKVWLEDWLGAGGINSRDLDEVQRLVGLFK